MAEVIDLEGAARLVRDGDHVLVGGSGGGHAVPEAWIVALIETALVSLVRWSM